MAYCKYNSEWVDDSSLLIPFFSRGIEKGVSLSQSLLCINSSLMFIEDVYFNLMAGLRKLRIDIPIHFTEDYFEQESLELIQKNNWQNTATSLTWFLFLGDGHLHWIIYGRKMTQSSLLSSPSICLDVYKDIALSYNLIESHQVYHPENYPAQIFAQENELDDVIFLNHDRKMARTIYGNIYLIQDNVIVTPDVEEGAYKQAIDKAFSSFLQKETTYILQTQGLSSFITQQSDEVFILSDKKGVISVNQIRNRSFPNEKTTSLAQRFTEYAKS